MKRHEVDTLDVMDVDALAVDLWYPRNDGRYQFIEISLMDVRAANNIIVNYDFDRDGWVVSSDLTNPRGLDDYTKEEWDALPDVEGEPGVKDLTSKTIHEVAFIPAWPLKGSTDD